jgi:glycosyltransferase involved in cell wall biosynthesis
VKICIVGKYPPIQGGVSAQTYWAARGLAERGHQVSVVTNAADVEETYRIHLDGSDPADFTPAFPGGGSVRVFGPEAGRRLGHIPMSNPFVSRLAGLATQVVRDNGCTVIVASYLEPYAVAGFLASRWTGVPLIVQHAGSDLERLMRQPELAVTYREVLRAAATVVTVPSVSDRFRSLGVPERAIRMAPPFAIPQHLFNPDAPALAPARVERLAALLAGPDTGRPGRSFDPRRPAIGVYGKVGETKGTFDLVAACDRLRADGLDFNLLMLTGPGGARALDSASGELADRTWVLPFIPHWQVPEFIRACTAVCFLERDFPIAIHGPTVPREVLACGTCLVLSGEIERKQVFRDKLIDGVSVVLVPDPKDRATLAERLRPLIEKPGLAADIGARGREIADGFPEFDRFVDAWEVLLGARPDPDSAPDPADPTASRRIERLAPWIRPLLHDETDRCIGRFLDEPSPDRLVEEAATAATDADLLDGFCRFLAEHPPPSVDPVLLADLVGYQRARLWAGRDDGGWSFPAPVAGPRREGQPPRHRPVPAVALRVERFTYDVAPVFCGADQPVADAVRQVERRPTIVCFARQPNLAPSETRLSEATAALLELCDGRRSTTQIAEQLAGPTGDSRRADVETAVATAVHRLRVAGLLVLREGGET